MRGWTVRDCMELYNVPAWGAGFFTVNAEGPRRGAAAAASGPGIDLLDLVQDLAAARPAHAAADALLRHPRQRACRASAAPSTAPSRSTATRAPTAACTRSRSTSSATWSRSWSSSAPPTSVGLEAGSKPELLVALALLETPGALIICNGYKDGEYIETALLAQRLGRTPIIVVDRFHELELIIQHLAGARHPPAHRRARPPQHQGRRQLDRVDRRPLEVRPHRGRDRRGRRPPARRGHARLPRAAALPHRLADHRHPRPQGRAARGEPHLRRAARDGRQPQLPRRRRRPRRRLRRLADQLPLVDELLGAGVRQRRRRLDPGGLRRRKGVPHPDIVTESGRAMVAHHSVLVFDVLGVHEMLSGKPPEPVAGRATTR